MYYPQMYPHCSARTRMKLPPGSIYLSAKAQQCAARRNAKAEAPVQSSATRCWRSGVQHRNSPIVAAGVRLGEFYAGVAWVGVSARHRGDRAGYAPLLHRRSGRMARPGAGSAAHRGIAPDLKTSSATTLRTFRISRRGGRSRNQRPTAVELGTRAAARRWVLHWSSSDV